MFLFVTLKLTISFLYIKNNLENFETGDVEDAYEIAALPHRPVQAPVNPIHKPPEQPLVVRLRQCFHCEVHLLKC